MTTSTPFSLTLHHTSLKKMLQSLQSLKALTGHLRPSLTYLHPNYDHGSLLPNIQVPL